MPFINKVVIVTGGSEGIGKALVELFLAGGAKVATCGRNYDKLYSLSSMHPHKPLIIHTADVSNEHECNSFINTVVKSWGRIDILVNNAGISMRSLLEETSFDTLRQVMDVNFWGTVYCTKLALPHIKKTKGIIAGVSSVGGFLGLPGRSLYSASKSAMILWLDTLRIELMSSGVAFTLVCPGFTISNIRHSALGKDGKAVGKNWHSGKMMSAEGAAQKIVYAIARRKRTVILTFNYRVVVWLNRLFPYIMDKLMRKYYFTNGELTN